MCSNGCAGASEERGPMWCFVDPVTNQVEACICDFREQGLQNNGFFFFLLSQLWDIARTAVLHHILPFCKCYFAEKLTNVIQGSKQELFWLSDTGKQRVDTDFIHAAPGFPMLLRNAHSFAVGLCKCSEHNTRGLYGLTELLRIKPQCFWSVEIRRGD